jgi:hypothetical protein
MGVKDLRERKINEYKEQVNEELNHDIFKKKNFLSKHVASNPTMSPRTYNKKNLYNSTYKYNRQISIG